LIEIPTEKSREETDADDQDQTCEWNIAHLPPVVVNKYGDVIVTEGRRVADLAEWSLTELHPLHQELGRGTIRVNPRSQQQQIPQQQMSKPSRRSDDIYLQRQLIGRLKSQLSTYTTHSARKVTGAYFYILRVSHQFTI
jgi:hypothetical protein